MRIKEVEELVGISKKNIRFYEQEGLLTPGRDTENSYRVYSMDDVRRLKQIKLLRKLDMPITEIRELLQGNISLSAAARRHVVRLDSEIDNISRAREVCQVFSDCSAPLDSLDIEAHLEQMHQMEMEGVMFVNIGKKDARRRYTGASLACAAVIAVLALLCVLILWANSMDPLPTGLLVVFMAIPAFVALGTIAALVSRIREIRGGEENDLSKY